MDSLPRHPWLDELFADPERAVTDLLSGRADKYPYARLSDAEFLRQVLPAREGFEQEYDKLEEGLLAWLAARRREDWRARTRLGLSAYVMALNEALSAVQMLELKHVAHALREQHNAYLRWLGPLRLGRAADPALELWRSHALLSEDNRFLAQWMHFCMAADNTLPPTYLTVALQGLRELPNGGDPALNLRYILRALAERYLANREGNDAVKDFQFNLAALRGAYPRTPDEWQTWWNDALIGLGRDEAEAVRALLDERPRGKGRERAKPYTPYSDPGGFPGRANTLKDGLKSRQPLEKLWPEIERLIGETLAHCRKTGESYYFIRSFCNLGDAVLKCLGGEALAPRLLRWLPDALQWERDNPHVWMLWAQCLEAAGADEQAEWVYWEMRRYFPDDEHCRTELARLLLAQGRNEEAMALLREAAERNPDREPSRVELARLLMAQGEAHYPEAERWLKEVAERKPNNVPSCVELARLHSLSGNNDEAIAVLEAFDAQYGGDKFVKNNLEKLRAGQAMAPPRLGEIEDRSTARPAVVEAVQAPVLPSEALPDAYAEAAARATRAAFRMALRTTLQQQSRRELEQVLRTDPDDLLAAFYLDWAHALPEGYEPPPYAYALAVSRAYRDGGEPWDDLVQRFPEQRRLTWGLRWMAALRDGRELPADIERQLDKLKRRQADEDDSEAGDIPKRHILPMHTSGEARMAQLVAELRGTTPDAAWLDRQAQELLALTIHRDLDPVAIPTHWNL